MKSRCLLVVAVLLTCCTHAAAQPPNQKRMLCFREADAVVVARLHTAQFGGILYSNPPSYAHVLHLTSTQVVKGPPRRRMASDVWHFVRQKDMPTFPVGKTCLVALAYDNERMMWTVLLIEEANADNLKEANAAK
jgi:hypothetical protein